jgi:7-carboxy-7-deazaguanine synthase
MGNDDDFFIIDDPLKSDCDTPEMREKVMHWYKEAYVTKEGRLPIMELFGPTIQGEGLMSGTVTHFLRTAGCGLRCEWCDSMFAVDPKQIRVGRTMMTTAEMLDAISQLPSAPYITFTGGDPCMHKRLGELVIPLNVAGMKVAVETQGDMFPEWLGTTDVITFSPKGPSSGNTSATSNLKDWLGDHSPRRPFLVCIKVVVFTPEDFKYAMYVYEALPEHYYDSFYITAGTLLLPDIEPDVTPEHPKGHEYTLRASYILRNFRSIADMMLQGSKPFNHKVHVGCQQHVLLWPDKDKGV